jgi:uncharacterized protein YecT (DUF1311 family)
LTIINAKTTDLFNNVHDTGVDMRYTYLLFVALLVATTNARAGDEDLYSKQYFDCMERSGGVSVEVGKCTQQETLRQDALLKSSFTKLLHRQSPVQKQQLVKAQNLWKSYVKANCSFYNEPDGGSLAQIMADACGLEETAKRANELDRLAYQD